MNELLYQKNQAVAALNRVEGFEPLEFARTIKQEDQEDQLYLDVKYRKLWFRLANPLGRISSHIVWFNDNVALAEAKIYLNYTDAPENYIANAFSMKFRSEDPKFGDKFLEMAETAAVGRALSDAGYGVQFVFDMETRVMESLRIVNVFFGFFRNGGHGFYRFDGIFSRGRFARQHDGRHSPP